MLKITFILSLLAFSNATLPYEFIKCKQLEIKKGTYLLKDKKVFHVVCDPEEHYIKPFRSTDSIIVIDDKYEFFVYAYIEGGTEKAWFSIKGAPRTKEKNDRHYRGPWNKGEFQKKILPRLHPNAPKAIDAKTFWKKFKKSSK